MARTLYLENGSTEYIFAGETEADTLQKIIRENLGRDCEELYEEILAELNGSYDDGDNYEKIADGYRAMLVDTMNALHEVLTQPRLSRKRLEAIHRNLDRNL